MINKRHYQLIWILFAALAPALLWPAALDALDNKPAGESIPLDIRTESLKMNLESDIWRIPDAVEIEYDVLAASGVNLVYNVKENRGSLDGNPLITATYGSDTRIDTARIDFNLDTELLEFSGGCDFLRQNASGTVRFKSDKILFQMEENWLRTPGRASIYYKAPPKEETAPEAEGEGNESEGATDIEIEEFEMETGPMIFQRGEQKLEASGPVRIDFAEGFFVAGDIDADLAAETILISGGINGEFQENRFSADRAFIQYGIKELSATGSIVFENFESDLVVTADYLWYKYKTDDKDFDLTGNVHARMKIEKKNSEDDDGGEGDENGASGNDGVDEGSAP